LNDSNVTLEYDIDISQWVLCNPESGGMYGEGVTWTQPNSTGMYPSLNDFSTWAPSADALQETINSTVYVHESQSAKTKF